MKKAVSVLMSVIMVFSVFGFAFAAASASGTEPGTFDPEKLEYVVSGGKAIICGYKGEIYGRLEIPTEIDGYPVDEIWKDAFSERSHITEVYVPGCVEKIGDFAFYKNRIEKLTLENGIKSIGESCFAHCDSLRELSLPESVSYLGNAAFAYCGELERLSIESNLKDIGEYDFLQFTVNNLKSIYYDVPAADNICLQSGGTIESIEFGPNVKSIPDCYDSQVKSVYIPDNVTEINSRGFFLCRQLTEVTGGKNLEKVSGIAFSNTPFAEKAADSDGVIYVGGVLFGVKEGFSLTDYTVKDGTLGIASYAFSGTPLESITFPESLRYIGEEAFNETPLIENGNYENGCLYAGDFLIDVDGDAESRIVIKDGIRAAVEGVFDADTNTETFDSVTYPTSFTGCLGLDEAKIKELHFECGYEDFFKLPIATPNIGKYDLYIGGELVENLKIPSFVTSVPEDAFHGCKSIKTLELDENVKTIESDAFKGCSGLCEIRLNESLEKICEEAFVGIGAVEQLTLPDSVSFLGKECFSGSKIKSVNLGNGIKYIPENAFSAAYTENVDFGDSVREIEDDAFYQSKLKKAVLPDSVIAVGNDAFYNCGEFTAFEAGSGLAFIGESAFGKCKNLSDVKMNSTLIMVGYLPFYAVPLFENRIDENGDGVFIIGKNLLYYGSSDKNLVIPDGVEFIDSVFGPEDDVCTISLPASLKHMNPSPFGAHIGAFIVDADNTEFSTDENGILFNKDKTCLIRYPNSAPARSYTVPDSVEYLEQNAFRNSDFKKVTLGRGMRSVGREAFVWSEVNTVIFPDNITSIEYAAFVNTENLSTVYLEGGREQWEKMDIDNGEWHNEQLFNAVKHYGTGRLPEIFRFADIIIMQIKRIISNFKIASAQQQIGF